MKRLLPTPPARKGVNVEQLRANLIQWITETEVQIEHVAGELREGGLLAGIMSAADMKATALHLSNAAQELLEAATAATQLSVPLFLVDADQPAEVAAG